MLILNAGGLQIRPSGAVITKSAFRINGVTYNGIPKK